MQRNERGEESGKKEMVCHSAYLISSHFMLTRGFRPNTSNFSHLLPSVLKKQHIQVVGYVNEKFLLMLVKMVKKT